MKNELEERKVLALEGILSELTQLRILNERDIQLKVEKVKKIIKEEPSFDGFLTYYKGNNFDGTSVATAYNMYLNFCPLGKHEPITKNKFSRLMRSIGYRSVPKREGQHTLRVFVNSEPF